MRTRRWLSTHLMAFIAAVGLLVAAQLSQAATITGVTANTSTLTLTISGSGLSVGSASVTLDSTPLAIISRTDGAVTATLPAGLSSGAHSGALTLTSGRGSVLAQLAFSITISAAPSPGPTSGPPRLLDANGTLVGYPNVDVVWVQVGNRFYLFAIDLIQAKLHSTTTIYFESSDCTGPPLSAIPEYAVGSYGMVIGNDQIGGPTTSTPVATQVNSAMSGICYPNSLSGTFYPTSFVANPYVYPLRLAP